MNSSTSSFSRTSAIRYLLCMAAGAALFLAVVILINYSAETGSTFFVKRLSDSDEYHEVNNSLAAYEALVATEIGIEWQEKFERGIKFWMAYNGSSECYVMGSSRVMTITKDNLPYAKEHCKSLTNLHGPTYFTLNYLKFMGILAHKPETKTILIDVVPWMLMPLAGEEKTISEVGGAKKLIDYYKNRSEQEIIDGIFFDRHSVTKKDKKVIKIEENKINPEHLLSLKNFLINIMRINGLTMDGIRTAKSLPLENIERIIRKDGSTYYREETHKPWPTPPADENISAVKQKYLEGMEAMLHRPYVSEDIKEIWIEAIGHMAKKNIKIVFVLPPFNPWVSQQCERINDDSKICEAIKVMPEAIYDIVKRSEASVIGNFDGRAAGLSSEDFIDCWHVMDSGVPKILEVPERVIKNYKSGIRF